ncbi:MAG: LysM peptidoglycan-binding domain-containing protein [Bernardetiaceae bacterium]|jgi:LysM repeat protein|nr:LysM peptidoglycan-binding domain-containing protein [Bernardetiaceae bacterium]
MSQSQRPQTDPKKRLLLLVGGLFLASVIYFAVDIMSRSTPPWARRRAAADSLATDSTAPTPLNRPGPVPTEVTVTRFTDDAEFSYTVRSGEVLSLIAEKFHFPLDSIKLLNGLATDNINQGRKLKVRVRALHKVAPGEVMDKIARRYGVGAKAIMDVNNISKPERLQEGKTIAIPRPNKM